MITKSERLFNSLVARIREVIDQKIKDRDVFAKKVHTILLDSAHSPATRITIITKLIHEVYGPDEREVNWIKEGF